MIKFFRKIRQHLLSENKFSKYLVYAIGEIVLVVLGILIALSINNWNQNKNERNNIVSILNVIIDDLEADVKKLENNILKYEDRIAITNWGLSKTNHNESPRDSLVNYLVTNYSDDKLSEFGFTKLQNTNIPNYFEFDSLINEIKKFYLIKGQKFNIMVDWDTQYTTQDIFWLKDQENAWEMTFISSSNDVASTEKKFPSLKSDQENLDEIIATVHQTKFRNDKWDDIRRKKIMKEWFGDMIKEALKLITKLNEYRIKG